MTSFHRPVFDSFVIKSEESNEPKVKNDPFIIRPKSSTAFTPTATPPPVTQNAWTAESAIPNVVVENKKRLSTSHSRLNTLEFQSQTFSPPNFIDDSDRRRPTTSWGPGREPKKAAGDVSLTGPQLLPFLIKASLRLPQTKSKGVQLRLEELNKKIGDLSEPCIKKLNFVVDALDRGAYDEAYQDFLAMQTSFPREIQGVWVSGLRLLTHELMVQQKISRVGSAGGHVRSQ
ncbi:unnamed protein product [Caenorhabditis angaria]|uniref:Uncharacterized protein n=1 Tax=Caenorhabditis angaria TaxID=860376 RepID=A0A9P1IHT7_9PELO|nr:unnamed protein product [Caenorhabditis angaria]